MSFALVLLTATAAFGKTHHDAASVDRLLSRVTFGATAADRTHAEEIGTDAWIAEQLDWADIDDAALDRRLAALGTLRAPTPAIMQRFDQPRMNALPATLQICAAAPLNVITEVAKPAAATPDAQAAVRELQRATFLRAVYSKRQLYERMVDFWENHFSVYAGKDVDRYYLTSFDRDAIRPFAMGNFRMLLGAVAHSPAMLFYLDNWQSAAAPATNGRPLKPRGSFNENYARELLELHTMGVDGGYTQKDVQEVARCFTGWSIYKVNETGLFIFNPAQHDNGEKFVLGHRIPPGGGIADGEMVLDILAAHPSTAHFIALKLARMFVSDQPPETLVKRAAAVFLKTNGSIAETVRCILTSRELYATPQNEAKVKSPFEYAVSAVRTLGAETDGGPAMLGWIARMGEPLFGRVTPDGYPDRAATWLSTGTLIERLNFAVALAHNQIAGTRVPNGDAQAVALRIGAPAFQTR
jgi:uncharacterized protein (DUF1800 family)